MKSNLKRPEACMGHPFSMENTHPLLQIQYEYSPLHQIARILQSAWSALGVHLSPSEIENMSILIHELMSTKYRKFHSVDHLAEVTKGSQPLEKLALLFHDTIYVQLDHQYHPLVQEKLKDFPLEKTLDVILPECRPHSLDSMIYQIFGVHPQETLTPTSGLNEFLSAIVAVHTLQPYLNREQLLEVIAGIQATIPNFLGNDSNPQSLLFVAKRMEKLQRSPLDIQKTLQHAVHVANRDIANFADQDPGVFIGNTWGIFLENNPIFRNSLFSIRQYRIALQKLEFFLEHLNTHSIFKSYGNEPLQEDFERLKSQAKRNIIIGILYIQAKMLELGLLESIAEQTGGDAPLVLFLGAIPSIDKRKISALESYLDDTIPVILDPKKNTILLKIMKNGMSIPCQFDFDHLPIASYLYERMTHQDFYTISKQIRYPLQKEKNLAWVTSLIPGPLLNSLLNALAVVAWTRTTALLKLRRVY